MTSSLSPAVNTFAVDLLKLLSSIKEKENIFFSPWSIFICMSMSALGARSDTLNELFLGLKCNKVAEDYDKIHPLIKEILEAYAKTSGQNEATKSDDQHKPTKEFELYIANKLLIDKELKKVQNFKDQFCLYYGNDLEEVDFNDGGHAAMKKVNAFVNETTRGKIPSILDTPPQGKTALVLLNAIYFEGHWKEAFSLQNTKPDVFFQNGAEATKKEVPFMFKTMNCTMKCHEIQDEEFTVLELPYAGAKRMRIFLPDRRDGVDQLISFMQTLLDSDSSVYETIHRVKVQLPKFKFETTYEEELKKSFEKLGVKKCFSDRVANFHGVTTSVELFISSVIHKAVVEVDEKSTKAVAVTKVVKTIKSGRGNRRVAIGEFKADHPFVFYILDDQTKLILFIGVVRNL